MSQCSDKVAIDDETGKLGR